MVFITQKRSERTRQHKRKTQPISSARAREMGGDEGEGDATLASSGGATRLKGPPLSTIRSMQMMQELQVRPPPPPSAGLSSSWHASPCARPGWRAPWRGPRGAGRRGGAGRAAPPARRGPG